MAHTMILEMWKPKQQSIPAQFTNRNDYGLSGV